ncbi:hypothetical protein P615_18130 [Brevibacillus laterosporus PE36]|nr:hypothetical protein P615_18130 [Brevibacillus laterosporus PE36]
MDERDKGRSINAISMPMSRIPRSTYYRWRKRLDVQVLNPLISHIRRLCQEHRFRYGYRKITALLRRVMQINHKRVQRIMREEGLQCRVKVKKRKRIGQPIQVADHLLKCDFQANHPLQKLVTDITYLPYGGKMLYLSIQWRDHRLQYWRQARYYQASVTLNN